MLVHDALVNSGEFLFTLFLYFGSLRTTIKKISIITKQVEGYYNSQNVTNL